MEWQKCPICNGVGLVSGGFYTRAGDCDTWVSANTIETCRTCEGKGIISKPQQDTACIKDAEFKEICANCDTSLMVDSKIQKAVDEARPLIEAEARKQVLKQLHNFVAQRGAGAEYATESNAYSIVLQHIEELSESLKK